jgi:hypothetical protein
MKTVLYCRVSTIDQTLDHQHTQAHQNGFKADLVLADHGVSAYPLACVNAQKVGDFSTFYARGIRWWFVGLTASDVIMRT